MVGISLHPHQGTRVQGIPPGHPQGVPLPYDGASPTPFIVADDERPIW